MRSYTTSSGSGSLPASTSTDGPIKHWIPGDSEAEFLVTGSERMSNDLESVYAGFEEAWSRGEEPELAAYLPAKGSPERAEALQELIRLDLEFRWRAWGKAAGNKPHRPRSLDDYRAAFPELTAEALVASGLIAEEYRARKRWGESPDASEFADRFDVELIRLRPQLQAIDAELRNDETQLPKAHDTEQRLSPPQPDDHATVPPLEIGDPDAPLPPCPDNEDATLPPRGAEHQSNGTLPEVDSADAEANPRQFGNYDLLFEIARGGMGVVYKARQRKLNRIVALKMIKSGQLASDDEVQRFYSEAEAAARLDHPHIVPVYDVGQEAGQHYFSMGFVDGEGLDAKLNDGPLPPRAAAALIKTIAEAVQFAHEKGIVHRDLKPANVLIDAENQPRITDFGLAKMTEMDSGLTATGQVMGTPSYMPPEQAAGQTAEIGPRSDVYSLGAILYCLLTGRPPFQTANMMDTLLQVMEKEPVAPRQINPAVDADLETICLKCLQKPAAKRYASAAALVDDLDRYLQNLPINARPVGRAERAWRWTQRHPARAGFGIASVLAIGALLTITVGARYQGRLEEALDKAEDARNRAETAQAAEAAAKEQLDQVLYLRRVSLAYYEWERHRFRRAKRLLKDCPEDRRQWEWHYVHRLCHPEIRVFQANLGGSYTGSVRNLAISPDGRRIATAAGNGLIKLWDPETGRETFSYMAPMRQALFAVAFSHDGKMLASPGEKGELIELWEAESGRVIRTLTAHRGLGAISRLEFDVSGTRFVSASIDGLAVLWDVQSGKPIRRLVDKTNNGVRDVTISRDGSRVATADRAKSITLWDAKTGDKLKRLAGETTFGSRLAFAPDGKTIACLTKGNTIRIWDVGSGREIRSISNPSTLIMLCLAFSPDGKTLVSGGSHLVAAGRTSGELKVWDVQSGKLRVELKGHNDDVYSVKFTPDGHRIVSTGADGTVRIWSTEQQPAPLSLNDLEAFATSVSFSRDGSRVAAGCYDNSVKLWNAQSGELMHSFEGGTGAVNGVAFSPDGTRIACVGRDVRILDTKTGRPVVDFRAIATIERVRFSPDGRWIACSDRSGMLRIWDAETADQIRAIKADSARLSDIVFSNDGRRLATVGHGSSLAVRIWDARSGLLVRSLTGHRGGIDAVAFSPDGRTIVSGSLDKTIKIWNAESGELLRSLTGHTEGIAALSVSPDGKRIASAGKDGSVRLWDMQTGQETLILEAHTNRVTDVAFCPEGKRIASSAWDKTVKIWNADSGQWSDKHTTR